MTPPLPEVRAAMPVMRALVRDADPEVQIAALALLSAVDPGTAEAAELYRDTIRLGKAPDLRGYWLTRVIKWAMVPALIKGLDDRDTPVRLGTVNALSSLAERSPATGRPWPKLASRSPHRAIREERRQFEGQAARALLSSLKDPDDRIRWIAAETLGVLRAEAKAVVPTLAGMVNTEVGPVPPGEVAIRSFQDQGQIYVLGENQKGGDPLRIAAIQALGGFGREAANAVPELVQALRDKDLRVRWFAAEALGLIGPDAKAAIPALHAALRSRDAVAADAANVDGGVADAPMRLIAAFALGRIGPEARAAIPDLIAALSGPDSRVRAEAARALGLMGPDARAAIPELIRLTGRRSGSQVVEYASEALAQLGPVAVPALSEILHDDDPEARGALRILGQMSAKTAVPITELVRCLRDRDAEVRMAAAGALAAVGDRPEVLIAVPRLIAAHPRSRR